MNIADPKYLEYLRDMPASYLLDILAEDADADRESIAWILRERGMCSEDIEREILLRQKQSWRRSYIYWAAARWLTIFIVLIVAYFDFSGLVELFNDDHIFKGPLLFLAVGSTIVGFFIGFKLTTLIYHGKKSYLYCGFPFPVGLVDLRTGEEIQKGKALMTMLLGLNALIGVSLALFPLLLIYTSLK